MLHIHLFGYSRFLLDGQSYRFRGLPKTTSLLAYLLLNRNTAVSRDHLAFLLWDDVTEAEARANLRRHLHDLLRRLPAGEEWIVRDSKTLQWNSAAPFWLDIAEFERLSQDTNRLTEAIALYTGDLLQASYEDWIVVERERFQALFYTTLTRLMERERQRGDLFQAMIYAKQLLSHDPLREDVMREYMLLRHASGDRAGALQLYQQFETRLAEELGVAPMPETKALLEELSANLTPVPLPATAASVPEPKPAPSVPHNLPARLTSFVGREEELERVCSLIGGADSAVRLLTITGPGGTGKTRLAVEAATRLFEEQPERFGDGIYFVDFSAVTLPERVPMAISETLGLKVNPGQKHMEGLKEGLREKRMLLLLDNFEHILEAAPLLADLLTAAPKLSLLVTSQALLHLYGEHEYPLPPLPLPDPAGKPPTADLLDFAAVQLFVARLQAVRPGFQLTAENGAIIAEICRCLDGMPLALELAAARGKMLSPAAMLAQLSQKLRFLTSQSRNLPSRHQTLRATVDWSYNLLSTAEQTLFAGAALFAGPFTAAAAQAILVINDACIDEALSPEEIPDLLFALADRNMVRVDVVEDDEEPRFRMLQTLREYGLDRLEKMKTAESYQARFVEYYLELAEKGYDALKGGEQRVWIRQFKQEESNFIAAIDWLFDQDAGEKQAIMASRMVKALARFWILQGRVREITGWLERARENLSYLPNKLQVDLLNELGNAYQTQGDYETAETAHRKALETAQQGTEKISIAHTLHFLAYAAGRQGKYVEAKALFQETLALYRELQEITPIQLSGLLNNLAIVHKRLGEYDEAVALLQETQAVKRAIGDHIGLPATISNLGNLLVLQGNPKEAAGYLREALVIRQQNEDRQGMLYSINQMASLAVALGQYGRGASLYAAADMLHRAMAISRAADGEVDRQQDLDVIERHLSPAELAQAQAAGAFLSLEEACALALAETAAGEPA